MNGQTTHGVSATGWTVVQDPRTRLWHWSAFGPRGGSTGSAATEALAQEKAQAAERDLRVPR